MSNEKKATGFTIDKKIMKELDKEKNKSKFINDLLINHFNKKKEKDKNDLKIISDFIQEMKTLNFKVDKLNELLLINTKIESISAQALKGIKDNNKIDLIIAEAEKYIAVFNEYLIKNIIKGD